jgi:hypothetical protein
VIDTTSLKTASPAGDQRSAAYPTDRILGGGVEVAKARGRVHGLTRGAADRFSSFGGNTGRASCGMRSRVSVRRALLVATPGAHARRSWSREKLCGARTHGPLLPWSPVDFFHSPIGPARLSPRWEAGALGDGCTRMFASTVPVARQADRLPKHFELA